MSKEIAHEQRGEYLGPVTYAARYKEIKTLFYQQVFNGTTRRLYSEPHDCFSYKNFTLYLHLVSAGTDDHYICFMPQFSDYGEGEWCDFPQGLFAALCFEDVDTATPIHVCFTGPCAGRYWRLRVIEHETTGSLYFTLNARVEFWS